MSFLYFAVSFRYFAVTFFILPWVFFVLPWVFFILPWVFFILPWVFFVLPWVFFTLPWVFFILPWLCLCCRDFNYIAVVLFFLPWQLWATVRSSHRKCSIKKADLNILNIHRKRPMLESLFNKVQRWRSGTLSKKDSKIGVFCEYLCLPMALE